MSKSKSVEKGETILQVSVEENDVDALIAYLESEVLPQLKKGFNGGYEHMGTYWELNP